jgi:hypothetical protein
MVNEGLTQALLMKTCPRQKNEKSAASDDRCGLFAVRPFISWWRPPEGGLLHVALNGRATGCSANWSWRSTATGCQAAAVSAGLSGASIPRSCPRRPDRPIPLSIESIRLDTKSSCIEIRLLTAPRLEAASVICVNIESTARIMSSTWASVVVAVNAMAVPDAGGAGGGAGVDQEVVPRGVVVAFGSSALASMSLVRIPRLSLAAPIRVVDVVLMSSVVMLTRPLVSRLKPPTTDLCPAAVVPCC